MEQFSLEKWLQDKSRKIVTRDGKPVRIVCWDKLDDRPAAKEQKIVALVKEGCKENVFMYNNNGDGCISALDLFFADEKEELTEFEKQLGVYIYYPRLSCDFDEEEKKYIRDATNTLLNLARKELGLVDNTCGEYALNEAYKQGKQDALKDLPKWKDVSGKNGAGTKDYEIVGYYLVKGNYAIYLEDLEKLPKEE